MAGVKKVLIVSSLWNPLPNLLLIDEPVSQLLMISVAGATVAITQRMILVDYNIPIQGTNFKNKYFC